MVRKGGDLPSRMRVDLKEWHPNMMDSDGVVFICGLRGSGKSTVVKDIIYKRRKSFNAFVGIAPTEDSKKMFRTMTPFTFIYDNADRDTLEQIVTTQRQITNHRKLKAKRTGTPHERKITLICGDDIFKDRKTANNEQMGDIVMNGRHDDLCLILNAQVARDFDKRYRQNVTTAIFCREEGAESIRAIFDMFFRGMFKNEIMFRNFFLRVTEDRNVLVFQKGRGKVKKKSAFDNLYRYKANPNIPKFRIGHQGLWYLHYMKCTNRAEQEARRQEEMNDHTNTVLGITGKKKRQAEHSEQYHTRKKVRTRPHAGADHIPEYDPSAFGSSAPDFHINVLPRTPSTGAVFRARNRRRG